MHFLPFWLGGLALGGVAAWSWWLEGRTLGVAGQVTQILDVLTEPELEREAKEFAARDPEDVLAALMAATAAEAGETVKPTVRPKSGAQLVLQRHIPVAYRILFLLFIGLGAAVGALLDGSFALRGTLGVSFEDLLGDGWPSYLALVGGGLAIGFGTRMAGGCTSGHGLTGCARLLPRSVLATVVFLGTAIAVTLLATPLMKP